ncbi:hypothetical protein KIM67_18510, partial [Flagellimonas sp. 389]
SGMSAPNFSDTLIGWADQVVQPNVVLGATGVDLCIGDGGIAYNTLINDMGPNWDIDYKDSVFCP